MFRLMLLIDSSVRFDVNCPKNSILPFAVNIASFVDAYLLHTVQILCIGTDRSLASNSADQDQTASEEAV